VPLATDQQVQQYVNERVRVRAEQCRALLNSLLDDKSAIDDVYAACNQGTPTWTDVRIDGPPHLLAPADVLSYNAFITALIPNIRDAADYPTIVRACVRPVGDS
jgi:hypothetical protein